MTNRSFHRRVLGALLASLTLSAAAWLAPASAAVSAPAGAALDWLADELTANGNALPSQFGGNDWGLTIDAVLALVAGQRGSTATATATTTNIIQHAGAEYFTGASFDSPNDRYAGPAAKALLLAKVQGAATGNIGGFDLEALLRSLMKTSGDETGRFSDISSFGDFSNGFGESLAVLALSRTTNGVPSAAIAFLLDQQCPGGGFRLFYAETDADPAGCDADAEADTDATSLAVQALLAAPHTPTTTVAVSNAVAFIKLHQGSDGGVFGNGPTAAANANSTGFAGAALRAAGATDAAAAAGAWIGSVQLTGTNPDAGAIALNPGARDAASSGIASDARGQFQRATAQGVLALGLDGYDTVGGHTATTLVPQVGASAAAANPGDSVTATGSGFFTDESVAAVLRSDPVAIGTKAASGGGVVFTFALPVNLPAGAHTITMTGLVSGLVAAATIQTPVPTAAATTSTTVATTATTATTRATTTSVLNSSLARTGAAITRDVRTAVLFVFLGVALVVVARRRRARA